MPEFEVAEKAFDKLNYFIQNKGSKPVDYFHKKLGRIMWNKCGMSRNKDELLEAISEIKKLKDFYKNVFVRVNYLILMRSWQKLAG